ncbi:glycosyl hydrolase [Cohnella mopanensis]|uniref:glycosyl hydrolase n=1 Tax=Cohnella mopanensis TaxID=2911966 RepID=UPI001EF9AA49|nr:glycosyl hydrolase [Cohnella mopanensis]
MTDRIYELFLQPPNEYRGKPFWSWNGKLEKEELLRQIHVFHQMGLGGFFIHSRTGLVTEYLGEEWFEFVEACTEEAERLGMEVWIYDEDRWPSGTAGGMVTEEPRFRLKFIELRVVPAAEFDWPESDDYIAVYACRLEGVAYYDAVQLMRGELSIAGTSVLVFAIVEMNKDSFYNGYTYVDTMNRDATDRYLEITHDRYKERVGKHFGRTIKGVFTDEPHRGALMDGFGITNERRLWSAPWTYTLFEDFERAFGYDLRSRLPELFLKPEGRLVSQVKWHYVELTQRLFIQNYLKPMQDWTRENGLRLTGHMLHEDTLTAQTAYLGSAMRFYEYQDDPGVDVLREGNRNYWLVKQLSSAARQLGQKWLLSELYGCTGWQMTFESHKAVGDWQTLFGINVRNHHLSWYTMEGESKRDYPASISYQSAWWDDYEFVETYFSRFGLALSQGERKCDVLVLNPVESVWCQVYPGWSIDMKTQSADVQKLEDQYRDTFHWLSGAQIDFDYADEEMLGRLHAIEDAVKGDPLFWVGQAAYRVVLVAGMITIRESTVAALEKFAAAGGKIIFAGEVPQYVDALPSDRCVRLAEQAVSVPFDGPGIVDACRAGQSVPMQVIDAATGLPAEEIFCRLNEDENGRFYFALLNVNPAVAYDIRVELGITGAIEEWDCKTGDKKAVACEAGDGKLSWNVRFHPSEEHLYVIDSVAPAAELAAPILESSASNRLNEAYPYRLSESNVCVLDMASYRIGDGEWSRQAEILQADRSIRTELELPLRGGRMIQPWYAALYHQELNALATPLVLRFAFSVAVLPDSDLQIAIESPDLFEIAVNGISLDRSDMDGWWVDPCFKKIKLPRALLRTGENVLELRTDFRNETNLEAVYLLGDFGVRLDGVRRTLVALPETVSFGDLTEQGFPFYGGKIRYLIASAAFGPLPEDGEGATLTLPAFDAACVKVGAAFGGETKMIAWQPYEADITEELRKGEPIGVEVVLTRRNTFGPLHLVPTRIPEYRPFHFLTQGESYSEAYGLIPSGILGVPEVSVRYSK